MFDAPLGEAVVAATAAAAAPPSPLFFFLFRMSDAFSFFERNEKMIYYTLEDFSNPCPLPSRRFLIVLCIVFPVSIQLGILNCAKTP